MGFILYPDLVPKDFDSIRKLTSIEVQVEGKRSELRVVKATEKPILSHNIHDT